MRAADVGYNERAVPSVVNMIRVSSAKPCLRGRPARVDAGDRGPAAARRPGAATAAPFGGGVTWAADRARGLDGRSLRSIDLADPVRRLAAPHLSAGFAAGPPRLPAPVLPGIMSFTRSDLIGDKVGNAVITD